jgi:hypothetical protein
MFNFKKNYQLKHNTNDVDLFIHELLLDIINFYKNPINSNSNFLPTRFSDIEVVDNLGLDMYVRDSLQELNNINGTEVLMTYRPNYDNLYDNCNGTFTYDFGLLTKDCDSKARLKTITDYIIETILEYKESYQNTVATTIDYTTGTTINPIKYSCQLDQSKIIQRLDVTNESFIGETNRTNFITNLFTIKFKINKII